METCTPGSEGQREKQVKLLAICLPYWLAPHIVQIAKLLAELQEDVSLAFYDYETMKAKNIYRQNFCCAEKGMSKAAALAHHHGLA